MAAEYAGARNGQRQPTVDVETIISESPQTSALKQKSVNFEVDLDHAQTSSDVSAWSGRRSKNSQKSTAAQQSCGTAGSRNSKGVPALQKSKSVTVQHMNTDHFKYAVFGKPLICPRIVPLDLLFFRRIFSNLHRRYGSAAEEVPVAVFQRSVVRLFRVLDMVEMMDFDAQEYDVDGSGAVGWFEFVTCWRKSKLNVVLSNAERIFLAMEDPGTCFTGVCLSSFLMTLIFVNCTCFMLATIPELKQREDNCTPSEHSPCEPQVLPFFDYLEGVCVAIFSLEYGLRLVLSPISRTELLDYEKILEYVTEHEELHIPSPCQRLLRFIIQPMNIIDLFAIVPFYIEVLLGYVASNLTVLRVLRLTRLFRLVKLGRYFEVLQLVVRVFNKSLQVLNVLLMYLVLGVCFCAAIMFFLEGGDWEWQEQNYIRSSHDGDRSVSPFKSIPHSFWWCIVTFTTVGYGDVYPVTFFGKCFAAIMMLGGVLVLAMPISAISMNFGEVWASWLEERRMEAEARMVDVVSVTQALQGLECRSRLVLEVHDAQIGNSHHEFLGEVEFNDLPVDSMDVCVQESELMPLRSNPEKKSSCRVAGGLEVGWTWKPCPVPEGMREDNVWGSLEVRVQRAEGLCCSDWKKGGMRDTYVVAHAWPKPPASFSTEESLSSTIRRTDTASETLDPVWNELLTFEFNWPRDWRPVEVEMFGQKSIERSKSHCGTHSINSSSIHAPSHIWDISPHEGPGDHQRSGTAGPHPRKASTKRKRNPWSGNASPLTNAWGGSEGSDTPHGSHAVYESEGVTSMRDEAHDEAGEIAHLRQTVSAQGHALSRVSKQVAEMHGILQRLDLLLRPSPDESDVNGVSITSPTRTPCAQPRLHGVDELRTAGGRGDQVPSAPIERHPFSSEPLPAQPVGAEPEMPGCIPAEPASKPPGPD
jgi:hypothetical protein